MNIRKERERERETDSRESYRLIKKHNGRSTMLQSERERERGERVSVFKLIISY